MNFYFLICTTLVWSLIASIQASDGSSSIQATLDGSSSIQATLDGPNVTTIGIMSSSQSQPQASSFFLSTNIHVSPTASPSSHLISSNIVSTSVIHTNSTLVISSSVQPSHVVSSKIVVSSSVAPPTPTPEPTLHFQFPKNGTPCIKFESKIKLQLSNNTNKMEFYMTQDDSLNGSCIGSPFIILSHKSPAISLKMSFNESSSDWQLINIKVEDGVASSLKDFTKPIFSAPINNSYTCNEEQTFKLDDYKNFKVSVVFSKLRLQAFLPGASFNNNTVTCSSSVPQTKTSSVVPIAVGGALAGLIVIVLVAYLIGRRRGNRGYQKV